MLTAYKAVRVLINLKADPKQKWEDAVPGRDLIHLPFIQSRSHVLHTYAGKANFGGYCGCLTATVYILYSVVDLERGQIF